MADQPKTRPAGTPEVPGRIVEGIHEAIVNPESRPGAFIRLTASGGVRGEEYEFEFMIDASGNTTSRLRDQLHGREFPGRHVSAQEPDRFTSLAQEIDVESLMRLERIEGGFRPDSVVGRLEVSDGQQSATFTFLADEAQAARAELQTPEPLRRAVDAIYGAAAAEQDYDELKP